MCSNSYQNPNPISNPDFDEHRWVLHLRRALDDEQPLEEESDFSVSIFNVPKILKLTSPDSYAPQHVAIGPCHRWRRELHEMERSKVSAARRSRKQLKTITFHRLVDRLSEFELLFRGCYQTHLNFNGEALAWMMAVDSCFLLEFLSVEGYNNVQSQPFSTMISHLVSGKGERKSGRNAVLRDLAMLENQIPLFSLRRVVESQSESQDEADEKIYAILSAFCRELSPFKTVKLETLPQDNQFLGCDHLLGALYQAITPKIETSSDVVLDLDHDPEQSETEGDGKGQFFWKFMSKMKAIRPLSLAKRVVFSRPFSFIFRFPIKIMSVFPGVVLIRQLEYVYFSKETELQKPENVAAKLPLMEEIAVPSVSELSTAGVKFSAAKEENISGIVFDALSSTLYLPPITLDFNTEVVMRNLVAYEACKPSTPSVFARYTELMNGIIDTGEDAKLLREKGIVVSHLKSDEDVASLWNGMAKAVQSTKVGFLDQVIQDLNKCYSRSLRVKMERFVGQHVFGSWKCLSFMAAVLVLSLMSFQAFCSVFSCRHHVRRNH